MRIQQIPDESRHLGFGILGFSVRDVFVVFQACGNCFIFWHKTTSARGMFAMVKAIIQEFSVSLKHEIPSDQFSPESGMRLQP